MESSNCYDVITCYCPAYSEVSLSIAPRLAICLFDRVVISFWNGRNSTTKQYSNAVEFLDHSARQNVKYGRQRYIY